MQAYSVVSILRTSSYALDIFDRSEIEALHIFEKNGKTYLRHFTNSSKERPATPEEIVRQLFLYQLFNKYHYPASRIILEKPVKIPVDVMRSITGYLEAIGRANGPVETSVFVRFKKGDCPKEEGLDGKDVYRIVWLCPKSGG